MHDFKLHSVEYRLKSDKQEVLIDKKNNDKLSPLSLAILDSIFNYKNKVTIILAQGSFNLSPLVASLFAYSFKSDILIGNPKYKFNSLFENDTNSYFSLMYKRIVDNYPSNFFYFYNDILWCKGSISEETNEMDGIVISTRPKHGSIIYKNKYDELINTKLSDGTLKDMPVIVSVPIEDITPTSIIGNKPLSFKNKEYYSKEFNPKLIIYESINERRYNFGYLVQLIDNSINSNVKLVLHFSWPYLRGLNTFLDNFKDKNDIAIFHFGKRFCIESIKSYSDKKPINDIIHLSLEGKYWDVYYPKNNFFEYRIVLPKTTGNYENLTVNDLIAYDWPFDSRLIEINQREKNENLNKIERNIVLFPPIFDSFLFPSETKRKCIKNGKWLTLPINETFDARTIESSTVVNIFKGMCIDIEKSRDFAYELLNLYTTRTLSKRTLLQIYLINIFNKYYNDASSISNKKKVVCIANLHPYLATHSSFKVAIKYLVNSVQVKQQSCNLPSIKIMNTNICMMQKSSNEIKWTLTLFKDGVLQTQNVRKLRSKIQKENMNIICKYDKEDNALKMTIKVGEASESLYLNKGDENPKKEIFTGLTVYEALVKGTGSFVEKTLSKISTIDDKYYTISSEIESCTETETYKSNYDLQLIYCSLSQMHDLDKEQISNSDLLIPGPIPFNTVTEQELVLSQGYDALLLPFKEVIFFAYPGFNIKNILDQLHLFNDLFSNCHTDIAAKDLALSLKYTSKSVRFTMPSKSKLKDDDACLNDTSFDSLIRQQLIENIEANDENKSVVTSLKDIWSSLEGKSGFTYPKRFFQNERQSKEQIEICVEFESGNKQIISFPFETLIRKSFGSEYILTPISELTEGDQIYFIQSDERESIENFLLRTISRFSGEECFIEDILEPLTALKIFYESLKSFDYERGSLDTMNKLYWLPPDLKSNLYDLLYKLQNTTHLEVEQLSQDIQWSIWSEIKPESLIKIFKTGRNTITQTKLFKLAEELGLSYKESSFKVLCSAAINEQKHYSFQNKENLLSIGKLIGHQRIIEDYVSINEKGVMIGTFLRQVGKSLKRVISGDREPFNEIDIAISEGLNKCTVLEVLQSKLK